MSIKVVRLYDPDACGADNPYFQTNVILPTRVLLEYLEQIMLGEIILPPIHGKNYNLSFQETLQLAQVFNIEGSIVDGTLFFGEQVSVLEIFSVDKLNITSALNFVESVGVSEFVDTTTSVFDESLCSLYEERVEADGGEVEDILLACGAYSYFDNPPKVSNREFLESITVADVYDYFQNNRLFGVLQDSITLNEIFNVQRSEANNVSIADFVLLGEVFSFSGATQKQTIQAFTENLTLGELFQLLHSEKNNQEKYVEHISLNEIFSVSSPSLQQFNDVFNDNVSVGEIFGIIDVETQKNLTVVDGVSLNEIFSISGPSLKQYNDNFSENITLGEIFQVTESNITFKEDHVESVSLNEIFTISGASQKQFNDSYIETLTINEIFSLQRSITNTVGIVDFTMVGEVFSVSGATDAEFIQTAIEPVTLNEIFTADKQEIGTILEFIESISVGEFTDTDSMVFENSLCSLYEEKVEADGGEVEDITAVCIAYNLIQSGGMTIISREFNDSVGVGEAFDYIETRNQTDSFIDTVNLNEVFSVSRPTPSQVFESVTDNVTLGELFNAIQLASTANNQAFVENVNLGESFLVSQNTFQYADSYIEVINIGENFTVVGVAQKNTENSYTENLTLSEIFVILGKSGNTTNLVFQESVVVNEVATFRDKSFNLDTNFIDNVSASEVFSYFTNERYSLSFIENVSLMSNNLVVGQNTTVFLDFTESVSMLPIQEDFQHKKAENFFLSFVEGLDLIE